MSKKAILIWCYAIFVLLGGFIGFVIAHSFASLITSTLFATILSICGVFVWKNNFKAYRFALTTIFFLFAFFCYRFFLTYKLMPGGIMAAISGILFCYLLYSFKDCREKSNLSC